MAHNESILPYAQANKLAKQKSSTPIVNHLTQKVVFIRNEQDFTRSIWSYMMKIIYDLNLIH